ncbi:MAG TPA: TIGR03618 family F420-dependent PPOX class oxidoreductase [Actinomycetota bacterium]|nr:TIGR03618 family F420-dependent PPOX class oxidoreductase [Actinomycetota bacterium]
MPDSVKRILDSQALAHLVTLNSDGSPQATCAWAGVEGDEIVIATLFDQKKLRNMRRDPRVTLSFETATVNEMGLTEYLVIKGCARVTEGGAPELLQELARVYLGPEVTFPPMPDPPPGYITRIEVERFGGVGPWTANS